MRSSRKVLTLQMMRTIVPDLFAVAGLALLAIAMWILSQVACLFYCGGVLLFLSWRLRTIKIGKQP